MRAAKQSGVDFVMHVVGFGVEDEDVTQLECTAQAGDGLYFDARDASELSAALEYAVTAPPEVPDGRLSLKAIADGELTDVSIRVDDSLSGNNVAVGRTYTSEETNPRLIPLPDGVFEVAVQAVGMEGDIEQRFTITIEGGSSVEKVVDFSTGEVVVGVTRNGQLSDAVVQIFAAGSTALVTSGRTYVQAASNPMTVRLTAGDYDVEISSVEIEGRPSVRLEGVRVEPRGRVEQSHAFESGVLRVGATQGAELVDVVVRVLDVDSGAQVAQTRTYSSANSNPSSFVLNPGRYRVTAAAVRLPGRPSREGETTVVVGETAEQSFDFGNDP